MRSARKITLLLVVLAGMLLCGACVIVANAPPAEEPVERPEGKEARKASLAKEPRGEEKPTVARRHDSSAGEMVVGEDTCSVDADCVPGGCCHPKTCVAAANAPTCEGVKCTLDCRFGTLDCGGGCFCQEGKCAARLSVPPRPHPTGDPRPGVVKR